MAKKHKHPEHVNHERWLISYADFITLLFAFFVVMFASSSSDANKLGRFSDSFEGSLKWEILPGFGKGLLEGQQYRKKGSGGGGDAGKGAGPGPGGGPKVDQQRAVIKDAVLRALGPTANLNDMEVEDVNGELVIRLPERMLYGSGDATLTADGKKTIDALAKQLKPHATSVRIEGHTDSIPIHDDRYYSNWELSTARATSVIQRLIEVHRMDATKLTASGYAEFRPLAPNDTAEGRTRNRRVELVVLSGSEIELLGSKGGEGEPAHETPHEGDAGATGDAAENEHAGGHGEEKKPDEHGGGGEHDKKVDGEHKDEKSPAHKEEHKDDHKSGEHGGAHKDEKPAEHHKDDHKSDEGHGASHGKKESH